MSRTAGPSEIAQVVSSSDESNSDSDSSDESSSSSSEVIIIRRRSPIVESSSEVSSDEGDSSSEAPPRNRSASPSRRQSPDYAAVVQRYEEQQRAEELSDHEPAAAECCLCYDTEKPILSDAEGNWQSITEYSAQIPENVMILGPCRKHVICKECAVQVVSNQEPPFISAQRIRVPCLKSGEPCMNRFGAPCYFSDAEIAKLLPEPQFQRYLEEIERFSLPGFELVVCPGCQSRVPLPLDSIHHDHFGYCIVLCNQNSQCRRKFCYHCREILRDQESRSCPICSGQDNTKHPKGLNHYFYKPAFTGHGSVLWRNEELTAQLCLQQLKELVDIGKNEFMEHGQSVNSVHAMRCFSCSQGFVKSQDCNSMSHCGIERCYVCGYSVSVRGHGIPGEHWGNCPRFDNSPYWNEVAKCKLRCVAGQCYGHKLGECRTPAHKAGIRKMHGVRRKIQFNRAFSSLLPAVQEEIKQFLLPKPAGYVRLRTMVNKFVAGPV